MLDLIAGGGFAAVFPTSDAALVALDWPGVELVDKRWLRKRWEHLDAASLRSWDFASGAELMRHADELTFPVAVKASTRAEGAAPPRRRDHRAAVYAADRQGRAVRFARPVLPSASVDVHLDIAWRFRWSASRGRWAVRAQVGMYDDMISTHELGAVVLDDTRQPEELAFNVFEWLTRSGGPR